MPSDFDTGELASIRASLGDVDNAVQAARQVLSADGSVDLQGMDARIEQLCARALALPRPLAQTVLPDLVTLLGAVDGLIATLTSRSAPYRRSP